MSKERMERVRREKYQELLNAGKLLPGETLEEYYDRSVSEMDHSEADALFDGVEQDTRTKAEKKRDYDAFLDRYLKENPMAQVCVSPKVNEDDDDA